jgi:cysteinyl-tRNA synthetase
MFGIFEKKQPIHEGEPLFLYNTLSKTKEVFKPLKAGAVLMYSCGPTVYDYATIGNLRSYAFSDILKRALKYNGYAVNQTINLTDFGHLTSDADTGEDKMMKGLKREGKPVTLAAMRELSDTYIDAFVNDTKELNILPANQYTRASDYVREEVALIKTLEDKGYTYETSDGVYFDISKFPTYGTLGNIDLEKLKEGARVEVNEEKRHSADFALWKKGLLGWDSKWGKGFPGWHVECTAMIFASLGKQIDIHTGGVDHIATHHNGEIAQAEAATGKQFVKYWMHNAFITIEGRRIGKSEGNAITLRNLKGRGFQGDAYRYWLLTGHYRAQMNFTFEALGAAKQALFRLKRHVYEEYYPAKKQAKKTGSIHEKYQHEFQHAINDDLDTPKAIAILWELIKDETVSPADKLATLKDMDSVLGIGLSDKPDDIVRELGIIPQEELPDEVQELVEKREAARIARNWEEADILREAINLKGYSVEDGPDGPKILKE